MLYLSEFTFPQADILLRKKDVLAVAQQKGHFFTLLAQSGHRVVDQIPPWVKRGGFHQFQGNLSLRFVLRWIWIWRLKNRASSSHPSLWGVLANGGGVLTWQLPKSSPECCKLNSWPTRTRNSSEWKTMSRLSVHWGWKVGLCEFFSLSHKSPQKFCILI